MAGRVIFGASCPGECRMSRRPPSLPGPHEWPPHLRFIVVAAERECPDGHGKALQDLVSLALTKVPARGLFDPTAAGEHALFVAVETVASQHLGMKPARIAWRRALRNARLDLETRDAIEHAALRVQGVSDTAYFYAGLAFGLAGLSLYRSGS
jgi:hypothetical protein